MTRYLGFGLLLATVGLVQDVSRMGAEEGPPTNAPSR
jgi:hypothetical protein